MKQTIKKRKSQTLKKKNLFQHLSQVTTQQNPDYWNTLSEEDKKTWSNYMIHRFLSMKMEWVDVVNEIQKYNLRPKDLYRLYSNIFPKRKQWLKYVKGKKDMKHPKWVLKKIAEYYEVSIVESQEYAELFYSTEKGKMDLKVLLEKYGVDPKLIKNEAKL